MKPGWRRYFRFLGTNVKGEVDEELRFHLEARTAEFEQRGYPHAEAERLAHERFGDADGVREVLEAHDSALLHREQRREYMGDLMQDIRVSLRGLRRTPVFTVAVLATLALGIGANTAVFSVVSRELLDPLPYRASDRLVLLYTGTTEHPEGRGFVSAKDIVRLQRTSRSLMDVEVFGFYGGYTYIGERVTDSWAGAGVGATFFRTLGVTPALGRLIDDRDLDPAAPPAVVLSHALWLRAFGSDSTIIGRTLSLSGIQRTVIGVTSASFAPPARRPELWTPLDLRPILASRAAENKMFQAAARLAPGVSVVQAQSELNLMSKTADTQSLDSRAIRAILSAVPIRDAMVGDVRPILLVVMGAALLVLLLACVNVAGLFLARASARQREMAVRAALGAGRWRLARQLVTETTVLGVAGGALGLLLAVWGKNALVQIGEQVLPSTGAPPSIDAAVLGFALALSLLTGVVAGLVPALFSARADLNVALGESSRGSSGGRQRTRVGRVLVAGQMALAIMLLVGAGLLGRTLFVLQHSDLGYRNDQHILTFHVNLSSAAYRSSAAQTAFFTTWLQRVRAIPGVEQAGMILISPWNGWNYSTVEIEGRPPVVGDSSGAAVAPVSEGYFSSLAMPLRTGRAIAATDREGALPVAVISERFARQGWPTGNPIGARIRVDGVDSTWRSVVGVVGDVRESASTDPSPAVYVSAWQHQQGGYEFIVHASGNAAGLVPAIQRELRGIDPTLLAGGPRTMEEIFRGSLTSQRLPMIFTAAFAVLALVLAVLGMYGIVAYAVTLRTREIGIRAALGGGRADILGLVLREGLTTAVIGTALGAIVAVAATRILAGLLYGVTTRDPATFVGAAATLLIASTAACLVPARRATMINPVDALRAE
jgi:predicted permease